MRPLYMQPGLAPGSPFCPLVPARPSLPGTPSCPGWPLFPLQFTSHWPLAMSKVRPTRAARPVRLLMVPLTRSRTVTCKSTCQGSVWLKCSSSFYAKAFIVQCTEPVFFGVFFCKQHHQLCKLLFFCLFYYEVNPNTQISSVLPQENLLLCNSAKRI